MNPFKKLQGVQKQKGNNISNIMDKGIAQIEMALASLIQEEDIYVLVDSVNQILQQKALSLPYYSITTYSGSFTQSLVFDFWQYILTGLDKKQNFTIPSELATSSATIEFWVMVFNQTVEEHFSGTIACLAKNKIRKNILGFLYRWQSFNF